MLKKLTNRQWRGLSKEAQALIEKEKKLLAKQKEKNEPKKSKYGNKKVEVDGILFDSIFESQVYIFLRDLDGLEFEMQKSFVILDGKRASKKTLVISKKGYSKRIVRVDFYFKVHDIHYIVDAKGHFTEMSKLKYDLLKARLVAEGKGNEYIIKILYEKDFLSFATKLRLLVKGTKMDPFI